MRMKIKKICSRIKETAFRTAALNPINKIEAQMQDFLSDYEWRETKRSFGELYPDQTFYVIRVRPITSSIGALMMWVCKQLEKCDNMRECVGGGIIPVIDFSYFENVYLEKDEIGKINPWEYFFEQPTMYSTRAVYHAKNVIMGNADCNCTIAEINAIIDDDNELRKYCSIYEKYIHISKRIEKKAESIYTCMISSEWRVLGCVYRGTDYRNRKVIGEHKQPSLSEEIDKAADLMEQWGCDHIFLATEDQGAIEKFRDFFGERLVYVDKERYPSSVTATTEYRFDRKQDAYYKGEEYLTEIYVLSHCNCLLSGRVGILMAALPMNNLKYEHKYIYDLGLYTETDYL